MTGRIPVEIEHIDGDWTNNLPSNLTLLCPNCHSLTPTYRALNRGRGRDWRGRPKATEAAEGSAADTGQLEPPKSADVAERSNAPHL